MLIRPALPADIDGIWRVLSPALQAGETYALPRDMTRAEAVAYWMGPDRETFVAEEGGCTWLIRSDGELVNWYTTNEWIKWGGDSENYDEPGTWEHDPTHLHGFGHDHHHPVPSTMPVRSRSRGRWSGEGM